jgi:hypothetical protein
MDAGGNVVIVGTFQGTADFGTGRLTSSGSWDIVVAKYSAAGARCGVQEPWRAQCGPGLLRRNRSGGNSTVSGYFKLPWTSAAAR